MTKRQAPTEVQPFVSIFVAPTSSGIVVCHRVAVLSAIAPSTEHATLARLAGVIKASR